MENPFILDPLPQTLNMADFFLHARIREGQGDRIAIIDDTQKWTYSQIQDRSNRWSHVLRQYGVQPKARVLIALPDSAEFVSALFGILNIGAVAVPINPQISPQELLSLIERTEATLVLIHSHDSERFSELPSRYKMIVGTSALETILANNPSDLKVAETHPEESAIWLFSGGTTGQPKIVMQSHQSFVYTTRYYALQVAKYQSNDVTLSVPKLHFGYALGANLLFPFSVGGTCILFSEKSTVETLLEKIRQHRPTLFITLPTMIGRILEHPKIQEYNLNSLRLAICAAEPLPFSLAQRWRSTFQVELLDGLGTSEMWHIFISNRIGKSRPGSLGTVVSGFKVRLCNSRGEEVPHGTVGRMWVQGGARALGYWKQDQATQEAFSGHWYISNDLLSQDSEGFFTYHGRSDDLFKLSGHFFSSPEVESCILEHPWIQEAAVVTLENVHGLPEPVACIALSPNFQSRTEEEVQKVLTTFIKDRLTPYKTPRKFKILEILPRTHLGKTDRAAIQRLFKNDETCS